MKNLTIIRQGDVLLVPVKSLPADCVDVPLENGRIVLMHGEVTGHAHAIADWSAAGVIADQAVKLAARRARLVAAPNGTRYLEVSEPVNLTHEEHTAHEIPPGYYEIPVQVEWDAAHARKVAD